MTFVNEKIPDADREKYGIDEYFLSWTVDRDMDAFLLGKGVYDPHLRTFILCWKGHSMRVGAEEYAQGNTEIGITIDYKINRIDVPDALQQEKVEIHQLLEEALNAYGTSGRRPPSTTMNITYSQQGR